MSLLGSANSTLLFIVGSDRSDYVARVGSKVKLGGSTDLFKLLGDVPYHRLHITPNFFRQSRRPELDHYHCLFNMITEGEQNSKVLENMRKLLRNLPGKVINRPEGVLRSTRDQVARQLSGIAGLLVPKAIRLRGAKTAVSLQAIERAGVSFPLILREAGTHTGRIVGRFDSIDSLREALELATGELIATEFVDFRSADGLYRKYRFFFIGQRLIFRHMLASDDWNVHAKDRARVMAPRPELLEEEERLFGRPEGEFPAAVHAVLGDVRERMPLDYFGMDFGIARDGQVVLFEANATMNFFPFLEDPRFAYVKQCLEPAQQALRELIGIGVPVRTAELGEA